MADAVVLFDEEVGATLATDTTWVDMALIPAASFQASTEYIVIAVGAARHASAANETRARLCHGSTPTVLTDASVAWEGLNGTQRHQVQWLRRFTQPGTTEDLKIQMSSSSTTDVTHDYSAILAFKASDLGTENTDWFWNEDTVDYTGTGTPTSKASETINPNGTDRWLFIAEATWDIVSITTQTGIELYDGTTVLSSTSQEGEDATNDFGTQAVMWAGVPASGSKTYSVRPFNSGSAVFLSNRIFALNLARFAQSASDQTAAEATPATTPSWQNVATIAPNPSATGDWVVLGNVVIDINTTDDVRLRQQIDASGSGLVSDPNYGDDSPGVDTWDVTDETSWWFLKKLSLTSGAGRTINIDAQTAAAATARIEDRCLVAFSVALAGAGPIVRTATDSLTFSDSAARLATLARAPSDSLTFSDSAIRSGTFARTGSDSLTFSDVAEATKLIIRSAADTLGFSDAASRLGTFLRTAADTLGFSDSATRQMTADRAASDSLTTSDTATRSGTFSRSGSDSLTFSDVADALKVIARSAADTLGLADAASRTVTLVRSATGSLTFSDIGARAVTAVRVAADSLAFVDSAIAMGGSAVSVIGGLPPVAWAMSHLPFGRANSPRPGGTATNPTPGGRASNPKPEH